MTIHVHKIMKILEFNTSKGIPRCFDKLESVSVHITSTPYKRSPMTIARNATISPPKWSRFAASLQRNNLRFV